MIIINPRVEVMPIDSPRVMKNIEWAGRTAYKSEDKITEDSYDAFIRRIIKSGHESVLEHEKITVKFVVDRGVSHELVRHRLASYTQESTRYCDYSGGHVTYILPCWAKDVKPGVYENYEAVPDQAENDWLNATWNIEKIYKDLRQSGWSAQEARSVLPNSLKTEVVMTANIREWRHFFKLRADKAAHPQMRQVAIPLLLYLKVKLPPLFDDISFDAEIGRAHV